jgi:DNA/RNA-binding domain of Phe-tRNA-synthetase-like protein
MKISFDNSIVEYTDKYRLGLVLINNIIVSPAEENLETLVKTTIRQTESKFVISDINKMPAIESTRNAYKLAGNDPSRYRPSAESLLRRIVKKMGLNSINNIVDLLNIISIKTGFSIGGYDFDKIEGNIEFGIGRKSEHYIGIGRGILNIDYLPVLRDNKGAFGNPTSDSERTMINSNTNNILFVFYDFGKHDFLKPILEYTSELVKYHCDVKKITTYLK